MNGTPPRIALRPETEADRGFSRAVYGAARAGELAQVPWSDLQRAAFLDQQFDAQRLHYRAQHPRAQWSVVVVEGVDAGRLYVDEVPGLLLLIDIALLPAFRGRGIGRALMDRVIARAEGARQAVRLHVEKDHPALGWYRRLGFVVDADVGVYWRMLRPAASAALPSGEAA